MLYAFFSPYFFFFFPVKILKRLRGHQSVIRIVLNKADQVDRAELRRVSRYRRPVPHVLRCLPYTTTK